MSVPKCGPPKSKWLLELANDVTFFRGPSLYDRLWAGCRAASGDCRGGGLTGQGLYRKDGTKNLLDRLTLAPRQRLGPRKANRGVYRYGMGVCMCVYEYEYEYECMSTSMSMSVQTGTSTVYV
jgi:hypothetical protein